MAFSKEQLDQIEQTIFSEEFRAQELDTLTRIVKDVYLANHAPAYEHGRDPLWNYADQTTKYFGRRILKPSGWSYATDKIIVETLDLEIILDNIVILRERDERPVRGVKRFSRYVWRNIRGEDQHTRKDEFNDAKHRYQQLFEELDARETQEEKTKKKEVEDSIISTHDPLIIAALFSLEEIYRVPIRETKFDLYTKQVLENKDY